MIDIRSAILVDIGFREIDGNRLREIFFGILVDIRCAILLDIDLLIYWKSVRYKIKIPYLAPLRLCVKYAS